MPSPGQRFPSVERCEAECNVDGDFSTGRALVCHDWEAIIVGVFWSVLIVQCGGFCVVTKTVAPRQQFRTGIGHCCRKSAPDASGCCATRPWCTCLFTTFCPCFQWLRVVAFIFECPRTCCGKCCAGFGCLLFTGYCIANPFGLGACACPAVRSV